MKLKKCFIIISCIYLISILIVSVVLFFPIKFAIKDNGQNLKNDKYEEVYLIETSSASDGYYVAKKQKNNIKKDLYFAILSGENFEKNLGMVLGLHSELKNNNKFIIYGKSYKYIPKINNYGFNVEKWDIIYPIEREPSLYSLFVSKSYLTLFDYIYNEYLFNCKESFN